MDEWYEGVDKQASNLTLDGHRRTHSPSLEATNLPNCISGLWVVRLFYVVGGRV